MRELGTSQLMIRFLDHDLRCISRMRRLTRLGPRLLPTLEIANTPTPVCTTGKQKATNELASLGDRLA